MDQEEFRQLALAELDATYRLAYHLAWRPQEAEDLVQETYLRAFKSLSSYRPTPYGIRPWLFKILHNVLNSRLSADQRRREVTEDLRNAAIATTGDAAPADNLDVLDWEDVDQRLKAAIDSLSLAHRTSFLLYAVEGLNYAQIADVTEVPVGTVMSRLFRVRGILAQRLAGLAAERGLARDDAAQDKIIDPS